MIFHTTNSWPQNGQGKGRHAASASELRIRVPPGTVVRYDEGGNVCGELIEDGDELLVARGGRGGRGNEAFKTNRNTAPKFAEKGEVRPDKWLLLELKVCFTHLFMHTVLCI